MMTGEQDQREVLEGMLTEASTVGAVGALEVLLSQVFEGTVTCNAQGLLLWCDGFMNSIDPDHKYRGEGEFEVGRL